MLKANQEILFTSLANAYASAITILHMRILLVG